MEMPEIRQKILTCLSEDEYYLTGLWEVVMEPDDSWTDEDFDDLSNAFDAVLDELLTEETVKMRGSGHYFLA